MCKTKLDDEASCVAKDNCNVEIPTNFSSRGEVIFDPKIFNMILEVANNEKQGIFAAAEKCTDSVNI